MILKRIFSKQLWIFVSIIAIGIFLRLYSPTTTMFGFDQVQILENAEKILRGDLSLIGPRTGPAEMFTGPLIYYVTALFMLVIPKPFTIIATNIALAALTGIVLVFLTSRYLDEKLRKIYLLLWAVSPFLVPMDRITWNPNIMVLASSLVFFPMFKKKEDITLVDIALVFVGCFLGYQAHFAGFFLPFLVIATTALTRKFHAFISFSLASILGISLSFLPTILFDMRHDWLNMRGLQRLLVDRETVNTYQSLERFWQKFVIIIETTGKVLLENNSFQLILVTGAVSFIFFIYLRWRGEHKEHFLNIACWLIVSLLLFSLYRGSTPEYYFLILIPAMLLIHSYILLHILQKNVYGFLLILGLFSFLIQLTDFRKNPLTLNVQVQVANTVKRFVKDHPNSQLVYDMKPVDALGLQYLLQDVETRNDGQKIHLVYPFSNGFASSHISNEVAVWVDSRDYENFNYISSNQFIIQFPKDKQMLFDDNANFLQNALPSYRIFTNEYAPLGKVMTFSRKDRIDIYQHLLNSLDSKQCAIGSEESVCWKQGFIEDQIFWTTNQGDITWIIMTSKDLQEIINPKTILISFP